MKESLRTFVKVLIRKGTCSLFRPSERIHSFSRRNSVCTEHDFRNALECDIKPYFHRQVQKRHRIVLGPVLPWGPADCGWSLRSQSKWCDHCCWHRCPAHFQPSQPKKICRAVWTCDYCIAKKSGGRRVSGMNWSLLRSGLKSWDDGATKRITEAGIVLQGNMQPKINE